MLWFKCPPKLLPFRLFIEHIDSRYGQMLCQDDPPPSVICRKPKEGGCVCVCVCVYVHALGVGEICQYS